MLTPTRQRSSEASAIGSPAGHAGYLLLRETGVDWPIILGAFLVGAILGYLLHYLLRWLSRPTAMLNNCDGKWCHIQELVTGPPIWTYKTKKCGTTQVVNTDSNVALTLCQCTDDCCDNCLDQSFPPSSTRKPSRIAGGLIRGWIFSQEMAFSGLPAALQKPINPKEELQRNQPARYIREPFRVQLNGVAAGPILVELRAIAVSKGGNEEILAHGHQIAGAVAPTDPTATAFEVHPGKKVCMAELDVRENPRREYFVILG